MLGFLCYSPILHTNSTGKLVSGKVVTYPQLLFYTYQLEQLFDIYDCLYVDYIKTMPSNISEHFNLVTLSYFIMSAASAHPSGLVINVGSFTFFF